MARIFYSVAGEGRGHATRCRTIVDELPGDHAYQLFAPEVAYELLSSAYEHSAVRVHRIPGLTFQYRRQQLSRSRTAISAAAYLARLPGLIRRLSELIEREQPDLIITDFEPALPRAAVRCGVPFISIDHQHILVSGDFSALPARLRRHVRLMRAAVQLYCRGQQETVVSSFYHPQLLDAYRDVTCVGVLLRQLVRRQQPCDGPHLVAYLRRFGGDNVLRALQSCGRPVRVYGLGQRPRCGRLEFLPISERGFLEDLATSSALVSSAGNQLVGEALWLRKPVLALPEDKNYEQFINAHYLRASGAGDWAVMSEFNARTLKSFLRRLDHFREQIDPAAICGNNAVAAAVQRHLPRVESRPQSSAPLRESVAV